MGSSLFSFHLIDEVRKAIEIVKANGAMVSFDPNIRKEMLNIAEMRAGLQFMLQYCDIFLPSGPELTIPTDANTENAAIAELLGLGISCIVVKRAAQDASYYDATRALDVPGYKLRQGLPIEECIRLANAAGALAVSRQGGMEGISSFEEMQALIERSQ
jgi:sugar/nucleoside kinase (ribokinase family)